MCVHENEDSYKQLWQDESGMAEKVYTSPTMSDHMFKSYHL